MKIFLTLLLAFLQLSVSGQSYHSGLADVPAVAIGNSMYPVPLNLRESLMGDPITPAQLTGTFRYQVFLAADCHRIQIRIANLWRVSGSLTLGGNAVTIKASLEINGTIYPATFSGSSSLALSPGVTVDTDIIEQRVLVTDTTYVRMYYSIASGQIPGGCSMYGTSSGWGNDSIIDGADYTVSGTFPAVSTFTGWAPVSILGVPYNWSKHVSVAQIGDSLLNGSDDTPEYDAGTWKYAKGYLSRALWTNSIGNIKLTSGGDKVSLYVANYSYRNGALSGVRYIVSNFGINDCGSDATATIKANLLTAWQRMTATGCKVYQCTLCPNTATVDRWTTLVGQTPNGLNVTRLPINAWLRDSSAAGAMAQAAGTLSGIIDVANVVETNSLWIPAANYYCTGMVVSATATTAAITPSLVIPQYHLRNKFRIKITAGTGAGQIIDVTQNTPANTVYATWTTQPDSTSAFELWPSVTLDGVHPVGDISCGGISTNIPVQYFQP